MLKEIWNDIDIKSFAGQLTAVEVFYTIHKAAIFSAEQLLLGMSTAERKIISVSDIFKFDLIKLAGIKILTSALSFLDISTYV